MQNPVLRKRYRVFEWEKKMTQKQAMTIYEENRRKLLAFRYVNFVTEWDHETEAPAGAIPLEATQQGVLAEMERDIRRRALSRVQVITRSMAPAEEEAYLRGELVSSGANCDHHHEKAGESDSGSCGNHEEGCCGSKSPESSDSSEGCCGGSQE